MNKRKVILVTVTLLVIIVVLFAGYVFLTGPHHQLTQIKENLEIAHPETPGNQIVTYNFTQNNFAGAYPVGKQITFEVPYEYGGLGTETIYRIFCDTPGFSLAKTEPALPAQLNVTLRITFNTPSEPYTGPFQYTVYYNYYP